MEIEAIHRRLVERFGERIKALETGPGDPWIEVDPEALPDVGRFLRDEPDLRFEMLNLITAVDYCEPDPKKAARVSWTPHLMLVYHLSSLTHRHRLTLKARLPRWRDDQPGRLPEAPTVSDVWRTADWHEREVYDLSGVRFRDHPDLRRILLPEDWTGHPLRKDYEFPEQYHGIRWR